MNLSTQFSTANHQGDINEYWQLPNKVNYILMLDESQDLHIVRISCLLLRNGNNKLIHLAGLSISVICGSHVSKELNQNLKTVIEQVSGMIASSIVHGGCGLGKRSCFNENQ